MAKDTRLVIEEIKGNESKSLTIILRCYLDTGCHYRISFCGSKLAKYASKIKSFNTSQTENHGQGIQTFIQISIISR